MSRKSPIAGADPKPLVSVIVPAWNAERTLSEALGSAAAQTYRNLEIIIVDDGSTDRTAEIAEEFCATQPRARRISKENGGVASARNVAIAEAKGEWIAPLDADDLWHPTKIEKQVAAALAAPETPGFVYCWRRLIDDDGRIIVSGPRWELKGSAFNQLAYINVVGCGSAFLALRNALLETGGYDESLRSRHAQGCEDMLLQLQVARRYPIAVVPEHLVGWRLHDRNMSSDFDQMARSCNLAFERLAADGAPVPARVVRWVASRDCFDIAQERAAQGKYLASLRWLADAIRLDPVGCGSLLAYRAVRSVIRRLSGRRPKARSLRFQEVDPATVIGGDSHEIAVLARLLDKLDFVRMERLAAIEQPQTGRSAAQCRASAA